VIQELILLALGLIIGGGVIWWLTRRPAAAGLEQAIANHMRNLSEIIDRRMQDNMRAIGESEKSVRAVVSGLGKLEHATAALQKTNEEISSFQNMLKAPKVRGSFGEVLLSNLLSDILPHDRYKLQYTFPSNHNIADAIIRLQDGHIVAIDAKFPLMNFSKIHENPTLSEPYKKAFIRDIKKHISDISSKYINPQEKTLDYAFMYIPIEGVYYEAFVHDGDLWQYSLQHKVIPVSPNSFLAYLQTILIGLRGMKIEQQAKDILQYLSQVRHDMTLFAKDFTMIGSHLNNAKNRYDDSTRRLDKLSNRLDQISDGEQKETPLPQESEVERENLN